MLNINSPTVQAMLGNIPQGVGNMPVYFGNAAPTITTDTYQQPQPQQAVTPYPSPKEMLMQAGQQNVYTPTTFAPRNIVGAYNPGYQAAFAGYSNPYMGYGPYGGYNPQFMQPLDEETAARLEVANYNRSTYEEQLEDDITLLQTMSRITSKALGRDKERAEKCMNTFKKYNKTEAQQEQMRQLYEPANKKISISVRVVDGEETIAAMDSDTMAIRPIDNRRSAYIVEQSMYNNAIREANIIHYRNQMHDRAPERLFDNMSLLDYFNNGVGVVLANMMMQDIYRQSLQRITQTYDKSTFRERLLKANGYKTRSQKTAIERYAGRYGIMPDGRPVSPGHDPSIASSFSYDNKTGQYTVTAPNFMRDSLEAARQAFIRSCDSN